MELLETRKAERIIEESEDFICKAVYDIALLANETSEVFLVVTSISVDSGCVNTEYDSTHVDKFTRLKEAFACYETAEFEYDVM